MKWCKSCISDSITDLFCACVSLKTKAIIKNTIRSFHCTTNSIRNYYILLYKHIYIFLHRIKGKTLRNKERICLWKIIRWTVRAAALIIEPAGWWILSAPLSQMRRQTSCSEMNCESSDCTRPYKNSGDFIPVKSSYNPSISQTPNCPCAKPVSSKTDNMYEHLKHLAPAMAYVPSEFHSSAYDLDYACLWVNFSLSHICKPFCGKRGIRRWWESSLPQDVSFLQQINEVSFAVNDMLLYLDTHPEDQKALRYFSDIVIVATSWWPNMLRNTVLWPSTMQL